MAQAESPPGRHFQGAAVSDGYAHFPPSWASDWGEDEIGVYADFRIGTERQRCRWIPPGRFLMGSPEDEPERFDDEVQHSVVLSRGYWLADTACTQALWQAVTGQNPSQFKGDAQAPVEQVSWEDVQGFLGELNRRVPGLEAGLPTEAQWEYACRAGTTTPFSFGAQIMPEQVNYDGNRPYAGGEKGEYRERTVAVKSLPPNGWGLYEMHGNVWEWCADWHGEYGPEERTDPAGPASGDSRVLRGGAWRLNAKFCRSARRTGVGPDGRFYLFGFRLAPGQAVSRADESSPGLSGQGGAEHRAGQDSPGDDVA